MESVEDTRGDQLGPKMIEVKAPGGHSFKFVEASGLYFSKEILQYYDPRNILPNLPYFKARDEDIFVCGFPRSGTNWTWEIVNMLRRGVAEYQKDRKNYTILELNTHEHFEEMMSPRILSSHIKFDYLPREIIEKKCKIIYVQRNPKDVALSHFSYRNSEFGFEYLWEDYLHVFLHARDDVFTSWFGTTKSWEKAMIENPHLPILLIYYEDLKKDPTKEITKIARFLEVNADQQFISEVVEKIEFSAMKKAKVQHLSESLTTNPELQNFPLNRVEKRSKYYRKGEVGDWKNQFTVAQSEYFDKIFTDKMRDSKLTFKYDI